MRKLKESVVYGLYALGSLSIIGGLFAFEAFRNIDESLETKYVTNDIFEETYPVVNVQKTVERPFNDASVQIVTHFYNPQDENHENSIIYYENTYMPNTGVIYKNDKTFDVLSIYEGEVIRVEYDEIMGNVVTIKHSDNILSVYQSIEDVKVKTGDYVNPNEIIGVSGKNNLSASINEHLHLEIIVDGKTVNPEECYGKTIEELNN